MRVPGIGIEHVIFDRPPDEFVSNLCVNLVATSTAIIIGATVAAAGVATAAVVQSNAASDAADQQTQAAREGIAAQERAGERARTEREEAELRALEERAPFREIGVEQLPRLGELAGEIDRDVPQFEFTGFDREDPGFRFRQAETERAFSKAIAAAGLQGSRFEQAGRRDISLALTADELDRQIGRQGQLFGFDITNFTLRNLPASTEFNRRLTLANIGQQAAFENAEDIVNLRATQAAETFNLGAAQNAASRFVGNAQAAGTLGQAAALSGGLQDFANLTIGALALDQQAQQAARERAFNQQLLAKIPDPPQSVVPSVRLAAPDLFRPSLGTPGRVFSSNIDLGVKPQRLQDFTFF